MDESILLAINRGWAHPLLDALFGFISQRRAFSFPLLVLILALLWRRRDGAGIRLWCVLLAVIVLGDLFGNFLKHLLLQSRPCSELSAVRLVTSPFAVDCNPEPHGMPSNHAVNFFSAVTFIAGMLRSWRWGLALGVVAVVVGLSRIYLGVHYPSQVLAGAGLGVALGVLAVQTANHVPILARWLGLPDRKSGTA